jgi:RND family efflux transporter MFP subunit
MRRTVWNVFAGVTLLVVGVGAGALGARWLGAGTAVGGEDAGHAGEPAEQEPEPAALVRTAPVVQETIHPTVVAFGAASVAPAAVTVIGWPAEVAVVRVLARQGQSVETGTPLLQVSLSQDAMFQLTMAKQTGESTAQALAGAQARLDRGVATRQELITAQAASDEARKRLDRLNAAAPPGDGLVRAPAPGVVQAVHVQAGGVVAANGALLDIASAVVAVLGVEPSDAGAVAAGQRVRLTPVDDHDPARYEGTVSLVSPGVNPVTRFVDATVEFSSTPLPRPGTLLRAEVALGESLALTVPRDAVVPQGDDEVVFVVREGKAVRTPVTIGRRLADRVVVTRGCAPGDQVVVVGQSQLTDGARVRQEGAVEHR